MPEENLALKLEQDVYRKKWEAGMNSMEKIVGDIKNLTQEELCGLTYILATDTDQITPSGVRTFITNPESRKMLSDTWLSKLRIVAQ